MVSVMGSPCPGQSCGALGGAVDHEAVTVEGSLEFAGQAWVGPCFGGGPPRGEVAGERRQQAGVGPGDEVGKELTDTGGAFVGRQPGKPGQFLGEGGLGEVAVATGEDGQRPCREPKSGR